MARTDITTTKLGHGTPKQGADIAEPAGTTIDASLCTNGARLLAGKARKTVLRITNTAASPKIVTIPRAASQEPGDADYASTAIPATSGVRIFTIEEKAVQADGGVYLNFESGHTGNIQAWELP